MPTFLELVEASLRIPFRPAETLRDLSQRPLPGYLTMTANWLFWTGLFVLVNIVSTLMRLPDVALGLMPLSLGLTACLVLALPAGFLAAGVLHLFAIVSGGRGSYGRSYQALTSLGCLLPISAVTLWLPSWAWSAPTLYGTFLAIRAVEKLHEAPSGQTWVVLGSVGAFLTAAQIVAHSYITHWQQAVEASMNIYSAQQTASPQTPAQPPTPEAPAPMPQAEAQNPASSLEMIQQGMGSLPAGVVPSQLPYGQQAREMQEAAFKLLDSVNQQLMRNPKALKNLPPEQAAQVRAMIKLANQTKLQLQRKGAARGSAQDNQLLMQQLMRAMQVLQNPGAQDLPSVGNGKPLIPQTPTQNSGSPYEQQP